jgi:hypothetical protein
LEIVRRQSVAQGLGFCEYEFWWLSANIYDRNSLYYLYYVPKCFAFYVSPSFFSFFFFYKNPRIFLAPQCHFLYLFNFVLTCLMSLAQLVDICIIM